MTGADPGECMSLSVRPCGLSVRKRRPVSFRFLSSAVSSSERRMLIRRFPRTLPTPRRPVSTRPSTGTPCRTGGGGPCSNVPLPPPGDPAQSAARAEASNQDGDIKRVSTKEWARSTGYDPIKIFNKVGARCPRALAARDAI